MTGQGRRCFSLTRSVLIRIAPGERAFKVPARRAHRVEAALGFPAQFVRGAFGAGEAACDVAVAARRDAIGDAHAVHALERLDHVEHRIALTGAEVPDRPRFFALRNRSEEHTSELQSLMHISYAAFRVKQ